MDQRETFKNPDELLKILSDLKASGVPVSLLVDREGLTRLEGVIPDIHYPTNADEIITFSLTGIPSLNISLNEVIAVNGIFRSDYTEC